jgi:predicted metal-dependent HD superfamily phosphohydrolase
MTSAIAAFPDIEAELRRRYAAPDRHYHGQPHIDACLRLFDEVRSQFADPDAAELAFWFHDAIYDAKASDNEEQSADLAAAMLSACGVSPKHIDVIRELILATKHNATPTDADARLLVDIDLSILGTDAATFDAYERAIRQEYAHVPDDAFRAGRAAVLRKFLARDRIYATETFASRYETHARENIARSLAALANQSGPLAPVPGGEG